MRNTHTHTQYTCGKSHFFFQPRSTFDTVTEEPVEINGAFLSCGGEPHPLSMTRTHSEGSPLTHSHARALCKCQTVGERVYLGAAWYFYTFLIASYVGRTHRNTLTHKCSLFQLPCSINLFLVVWPPRLSGEKYTLKTLRLGDVVFAEFKQTSGSEAAR